MLVWAYEQLLQTCYIISHHFILLSAPVDDWNSDTELAFPDDGELLNKTNYSMFA